MMSGVLWPYQIENGTMILRIRRVFLPLWIGQVPEKH
jgi:hypothetical protein